MTTTLMLPSHGPTCSHARKFKRKDIKMRMPDRTLTPADYPELASRGFIAFRLRPNMTRQRLGRVLRRQEKILKAFGYRVSEKPDTSKSEKRCELCNNCIITGLTDGKTYRPFYFWCGMMGQPVCPDGCCPRHCNGWGPVVQVLRGQMSSIPSSPQP